MDAEWHGRVKALFLAARERRPEERAEYLAEACSGSAELRREVESLLIEHDRSGLAGEAPAAPATTAEPADPANDPFVGTTLGRYRLLGVVGKGGMGTVYEAEDPELRRKVALKVLPAAVAGDPGRLERFKREARSAAALSHPNVVTLFSVEEDGGTHFLTMELVRGELLDSLIPEQGLDLGEILERAIQLAEGLRAAHEQGIVHRDLKPANVIIDAEGRLRILDFGLATTPAARPEVSQAETSLALTVQGTVLGTAPYMSPEQVEGKPLDQRSDIFSLGSILYEMATGRRPFPGETIGKVMSAILRDEPTPLSRMRSDLPEGLQRIVDRCLAKEPAKRYQSARELRDALAELGHAPSTTRPLAAGRWVALAAVLGALLLAAALTLYRSIERAPPAEGPTAAAPLRKMVAVLPFQNLGSSEDEYFAIGMTEEIASRMASVRSIGVIATSSTRRYAGTRKTAREIGDELGAGFLVTGSILWARSNDGSSRIRITPQLVSARDETQIWAQSYDRILEDVFAMQAEIASEVVTRLGISLADSESAAVKRLPTDNLEAYDAYLRATAVPVDNNDPSSILSWIDKLSRVVELDPAFAEAWFRLANANGWLYTLRWDTSAERQRLALEAAQRVEELAPGSALAASAMGQYLYRVERDYDRALAELTRAVELDPNSSTVFWLHGSALRRKADFQGAVESYRAAVALDPSVAHLYRNLGIAYRHLRRYEQALEAVDQAIALDGDIPSHAIKVETLWAWDGHLTAARRAVEGFPMQRSPVTGDYLWFWQAAHEGDFRAALDRARTTRGEWLGMPVYLRPRELLAGLAHEWLGERALAEQQLESAVTKLRTRLADDPDNEKAWSSLGVALAALGRRDEALAAAHRATEIVPLATDPWFAQAHIEDLAWVHTLLGDDDSALEQLEVLLERPSRITVSLLELDPRWAPLRDQPDYGELKERFGKLGSSPERTADRGRVDPLTS